MSRSTQFFGLSDGANEWLKENCISEKVETVRRTYGVDGVLKETSEYSFFKPVYEEISGEKILGMFGEFVCNLKEYTTKDGKKVIEFIQAEPWSSGPCIFLALKYKDTNKVIKKSLHSRNVIKNC